MELTVSRHVLLKALQRIQGIVERRNTMPILSNVLLEAGPEALTLFATDLEIGIRATYPATIGSGGTTTVSARKLFEIARELPEANIRLFSDEAQGLGIECARSRFRVAALPSTDFPTFPSVDADPLVGIARADFLELVRKSTFAVGENDARYILNGVFCTVERGLIRFVGTDGHRLAVAEKPVATLPKGTQTTLSAIIPKKALLEIKKLAEESDQDTIDLHIGKTQITFVQEGVILLARLMDGNYPNYQQVIPSGNDKRVVVEKSALEGALRRVALLSKERTNAVKFQVDPSRVTISSSNPDVGEAREELEAAYDGESFASGFNARYLLDALGALGGTEATLELKDPLSPCLIREPAQEGFLCVVMPMRV